MDENLQMKLIEKLVNKKFEYWKEEFIKRLKEKNKENLYGYALNNANKNIDEISGDLK